ncbi:MAG: response regulator [Ignavibacteriales bacterium]|nr:response regulator [Ignavibacteriales bacterium]
MAKILYIEDIQDNITLVEKIVKSRGHEFLFAQNAEEGLELAFASRPDLILLDLGLPDADGRNLVRLAARRPDTEFDPHYCSDSLARGGGAADGGCLQLERIPVQAVLPDCPG